MTAFDQPFNGIETKSGANAANGLEPWTLLYRLQQESLDADTWRAAKDFLADILKALPLSSHKQQGSDELTLRAVKPLPKKLATADNQAEALYQNSPILLTQPFWLHQICLAGQSHLACNIGMMKVYDCLTRNPAGRFELQRYRLALLQQSGHKIFSPGSYLFSQSGRFLPAFRDFAVLQSALGQFPQQFFPEILGFSLAYCQSATLFEQCFPNQMSHRFFSLHRQHQQRALPVLQAVIADYLGQSVNQEPTRRQRIRHGFTLFQQQLTICRDQLHDLLLHPVSIEQQLADIFQQNLPAALGHHGRIELNGQALELWLQQLPERCDDFFDALKKSAYVDRQQPENSRLLALFAPGGPMTGVLTATEFTVLRRWLTGQQAPYSVRRPSTQKPVQVRSPSAPVSKSFALRECYHKLVNQDLDPPFLTAIKQKLSRQLRLCRMISQPPFRHFDPESFEAYFQTLYQREMAAYRPLKGKPKISKAAYLWGLQQIAPMVLIDGCWLQHCLKLQSSHVDISELLFSIYADELGNGCVAHNHPRIFRRLLDSLSIRLPQVQDKAFAQHPDFIHSAFDLPVFMLSLSNFPRYYLAELLGLNLAIEISGLGRHYLTLVDEWRYWGIDSTIADVHISIDNVASGHTFLAKQAIHLYLDDIQQKSADPGLVDHHWRRIWSGYTALRLIGWRFKCHLPSLYLFRKLSSRLQHVE